MIFSVAGDHHGQGLHHMTGVLVQNTELETCYQPRSPPSSSSTDSTVPSPVWPHEDNKRDKWFIRQPDRDRCFEIRHHQGPQKQQAKQQPTTTAPTQQQQEPCCQIQDTDSDNEDEDDDLECVLENDTEHSNETPDQVDHKSKEEMDKVIAELTSAIVKSKAVSAMAKAEKGVKQVAVAAKKDDLPDYSSNSSRKVRTLKNLKHPATGRKKHHSFHNKAYLHDERIKTARGAANFEQFNPAFIASSEGRRIESHNQGGHYLGDTAGVWQLTRKQRHAGLCGELDYKNYNYNYGLFLHDELQRQNYLSQEWWSSYGDQMARRRKKQKLCRKIFKSVCVVILLISFVVVVICVSVFIIKDKYKPS